MTVSQSNVRRGAVHTLTLDSRATGRQMTVCVITPPDHRAPEMPLSVLYFLHPWGLSPRYLIEKLCMPDHLWAGIARGALPPFVIALPEGGKSFYVNALDPPDHDWAAVVASQPSFYAHALEQYGRFGDYLWNEVMPAVEARFAQGAQVFSFQQHLTLVGQDQTGDQVEQRGLSASAGTFQGALLALLELEFRHVQYFTARAFGAEVAFA